MNIVIATKNEKKIKAIAEAFNNTSNLNLASIDAVSGVPEQPINEDVYKGAINRIESVKSKLNGEYEYDYIVSCEGGLIEQYGNWFNVQVVALEDKVGTQKLGISSGLQVPKELVTEIVNTNIATVMDKMFDNQGGISFLSKGLICSRTELVTEATLMAIASLNWDKEMKQKKYIENIEK